MLNMKDIKVLSAREIKVLSDGRRERYSEDIFANRNNTWEQIKEIPDFYNPKRTFLSPTIEHYSLGSMSKVVTYPYPIAVKIGPHFKHIVYQFTQLDDLSYRTESLNYVCAVSRSGKITFKLSSGNAMIFKPLAICFYDRANNKSYPMLKAEKHPRIVNFGDHLIAYDIFQDCNLKVTLTKGGPKFEVIMEPSAKAIVFSQMPDVDDITFGITYGFEVKSRDNNRIAFDAHAAIFENKTETVEKGLDIQLKTKAPAIIGNFRFDEDLAIIDGQSEPMMRTWSTKNGRHYYSTTIDLDKVIQATRIVFDPLPTESFTSAVFTDVSANLSDSPQKINYQWTYDQNLLPFGVRIGWTWVEYNTGSEIPNGSFAVPPTSFTPAQLNSNGWIGTLQSGFDSTFPQLFYEAFAKIDATALDSSFQPNGQQFQFYAGTVPDPPTITLDNAAIGPGAVRATITTNSYLTIGFDYVLSYLNSQSVWTPLETGARSVADPNTAVILDFTDLPLSQVRLEVTCNSESLPGGNPGLTNNNVASVLVQSDPNKQISAPPITIQPVTVGTTIQIQHTIHDFPNPGLPENANVDKLVVEYTDEANDLAPVWVKLLEINGVGNAHNLPTSATLLTADPGKAYQYRVIASTPLQYTAIANSNIFNNTEETYTTPNVTAALINDGQIDISWSASVPVQSIGSVVSYVIERSSNANPFVNLTTLGPSTLAFSDLAVTEGNTYQYRVKATGTVGNDSEYGLSQNVTITGFCLRMDDTTVTFDDTTYRWNETCSGSTVAPGNVPNLNISQTADDEVLLDWNPATNASFYELEYTDNPSSPTWQPLTTIGNLSFTHSGVQIGKSYKYRIRGVNSIGNSAAWTESADITIANLNEIQKGYAFFF